MARLRKRIKRKPSPHAAREHQLFKSPIGFMWTVAFDGGCQNNGRSDATATWGMKLVVGECEITRHGAVEHEIVTNNVAEWMALINGLKYVSNALKEGESPPDAVLIRGDSDLVIRTLRGDWTSRKPHLTALRDHALDLLAGIGLPWYATWIPRAENAEVDALTRLTG